MLKPAIDKKMDLYLGSLNGQYGPRPGDPEVQQTDRIDPAIPGKSGPTA